MLVAIPLNLLQLVGTCILCKVKHKRVSISSEKMEKNCAMLGTCVRVAFSFVVDDYTLKISDRTNVTKIVN